MCLGPLPHLGDLVKVSAGRRDVIKDHVYCSKICGGKKSSQKKITSLTNSILPISSK